MNQHDADEGPKDEVTSANLGPLHGTTVLASARQAQRESGIRKFAQGVILQWLPASAVRQRYAIAPRYRYRVQPSSI